MSRLLLLRCIGALGAMAALIASAQPAPAAPAAVAATPAPAQAAGYRSTLEGYQPFAQEKILPWRQANETVGKIGGWRAYAKEAQDSAAPAGDQAPRRDPAGPAAGPGKH